MSKKCELTGKIPLKGHNVSHANNKTKRRFLPNLKKVKFTSELLKRSMKLTVSNAGVRSVDKKGSFDEFLKTVKNKNLSPRLKKMKKNQNDLHQHALTTRLNGLLTIFTMCRC